MKLISPLNEINYGSYDEGLDWNIQNYQTYNDGKTLTGSKSQALLCYCLRINFFAEILQAEIEFLKSGESLRILLIGYDTKHDVYLEKSWMLVKKQFAWEDSPEKYHIQGRSLGLDFSVQCDGSGSLHFHFAYFDAYQIHFISHIHRAERKPLRNVNPFDFNTWSLSEKHAMMDCNSMELTLDGNSYLQPQLEKGADFNLSYEWLGGHFPCMTKELRSQFWQAPNREPSKKNGEPNKGLKEPNGGLGEEKSTEPENAMPLDLNTSELFTEKGREEFYAAAAKEPILPQHSCSPIWAMAGSLLLMGHDSCSSESAIWVEQKIRYLLPRIVPIFGRSEQSRQAVRQSRAAQSRLTMDKNVELLPDLEWKILAGKHLSLSFQPFSVGDASKQVFPLTQTQRLYGLFYGKLLDQFGDAIAIQKALGFIDYRQIQWRKC